MHQKLNSNVKKIFLKFQYIIGFNFSKDYACGLISKNKLIEKVDNSKITCISSSKDRYKRYLATCYKEKINLNQWMVRKGYAVAYVRYSKDYLER